MKIKDVDAYVEAFKELAAVNWPLAMRILLVRNIIEQRGLETKQIEALTGFGKRWVYQALTFNAVRVVDDDTKDRRLSWASAHDRLDKIEHAITLWTRKNGGVYGASGSTQAYADDFQAMTSSARATQIFNRQED